jgi:putative oxidoreductase
MRWLFTDTKSLRGSAGLLLLRVVVGAAFVLHGWPKIQNPMGWSGPDSQFPGFMQALAAVAEFGGGIALILGLLTPLAALGLAATMVMAIFSYHVPQGHVFVGDPRESFELAAGYLASSVALLLLGPGRFSVDGCLFGACATSCGAAKQQPASAA